MLPLKDNIPTDRLPLVTLLLIAANVLAWCLLREGGVLQLLADVLFLWIFGPTIEDSMSRPRFALLFALGGLAALGLHAALDPGAAIAAAGAAGGVAAVLGGYARLYGRARVVTVVLVPLLFTLIEVPAGILLALWLPLQALLGGWAVFAAQAGGLAFGLLAIPAFAQRRKRQAPVTAERTGMAFP